MNLRIALLSLFLGRHRPLEGEHSVILGDRWGSRLRNRLHLETEDACKIGAVACLLSGTRGDLDFFLDGGRLGGVLVVVGHGVVGFGGRRRGLGGMVELFGGGGGGRGSSSEVLDLGAVLYDLSFDCGQHLNQSSEAGAAGKRRQ